MPTALKNLIETLSLLPGIWEKTAMKLALFLTTNKWSLSTDLSKNLKNIQTDLQACPSCNGLMDMGKDLCSICENSSRDTGIICVVEEYLDMINIEDTGVFDGKYHVLGGAVSPLRWIYAKDLTLDLLFSRLKDGNIKEIILATNPNYEWEATALYIKEHLPWGLDMEISRLSRGLPNAGYIEHVDQITLINAFRGRRDMNQK